MTPCPGSHLISSKWLESYPGAPINTWPTHFSYVIHSNCKSISGENGIVLGRQPGPGYTEEQDQWAASPQFLSGGGGEPLGGLLIQSRSTCMLASLSWKGAQLQGAGRGDGLGWDGSQPSSLRGPLRASTAQEAAYLALQGSS